MLTEAYSEIRNQGRKNIKYSERIQPFLDNSVIKDYIYHIYGEYNLPDPVVSD